MKKLFYLIVAILALGLIVSGCIPVVPPTEQSEPTSLTRGPGVTYYVRTDGDNSNDGLANDPAQAWLTISYAISQAAPTGDTIFVAAGTYSENIIIDKSLTIVSIEGPEVTIIDAQEISFGVFIIEGTTIATFEGFTVENYIIAGILAGSFGEPEEDPFEVNILNNIVKEPKGQEHNNCIQIGDGTTGTIIGNEVFGALLVDPNWSGSGILVAGSSNVLVSENYVHDCEGGIQICGYDFRLALAEDNLIENNLVEDCKAGISVQGDSIGTIIRYNDVFNNDTGIGSLAYDYPWQQSTPSGTEIHYNNIVGNINYGVKSSVWFYQGTGDVLAEEVDATRNWWGHASGPSGEYGRVNKQGKVIGKGDAVSANVDWDPWLPQPVGHTPHHPVPPGLLK